VRGEDKLRTIGFALLVALFSGCGPWTQATAKAPTKPPPAPVAAATNSGPAGKPGSDWPRFLGPTGDSVSTEKGILKTWPEQGLRVVWRADLGQGYCPPTVAGDRVYLFDRVRDLARLSCRDRMTGEEKWQFTYATDYRDMYGYDGGPRACPVVDGDRVYIYGPEGMLHCLNVADGKPVWQVDTIVKYGVVPNFFGVGGAPVVHGDLLIVPVGGSPTKDSPVDLRDRDPATAGRAIVAFDKRTGGEKYHTGDELASYSVPIVTTINGHPLGLYFARGGLLGFDPAGGKVEFHYPWRARIRESVNASSPVVVGDQVLITECYGTGSSLLKLKPGGYDVLWHDEPDSRQKRLECHWNTPIHVDGYVYGSSGRHEPQAELRCVELATGKVQWRVPRLTRSQLLLADGHFVVLTEYGELLLVRVNPKQYEEVARIDYGPTGQRLLRNPVWAAPVLSHGLLYIRGQGRFLCLELIPST
jgi:outer membrane protein assembly factor BamB